MAETITLTGVESTQPIVLNGDAQVSQVLVTGVVAAKGEKGDPGRDGVDGVPGVNSWGGITGSIAAQTDLQTSLETKLTKTSNLSDISNAATARTNLGLTIGTNVEPAITATTSGDYLRGDKAFANFNTAVRSNRLDQMGAPTASVNMASQRLTSLADPASSQDAATKFYVDSLAQGLSVKASVTLATAAALPTSTYGSNVITASANGALSVDGTTPSVSDRILVKNESTAARNGIYTVTAVGSAGTPFILTRATDMDANSEVSGAFTFVVGGTVNASTGWIVATPPPFVLGTTSIAWTQFSSSSVPDATSSIKGKVQLAGDLGGTASLPTVPGLKAAYVQLAANPDSIIFGTITRDSNEAATSAPVIWPDGITGTYTATSVSTAFPGAVDAYTITYAGSTTVTYTQPTVTRDTNGAVTSRPAIVVS